MLLSFPYIIRTFGASIEDRRRDEFLYRKTQTLASMPDKTLALYIEVRIQPPLPRCSLLNVATV